MPVIRFVREGRDVGAPRRKSQRRCTAGRDQLYGLKGQLGNCGAADNASPVLCLWLTKTTTMPDHRTVAEDNKLRRRPQDWRLACQALVERSVLILTRPQVRLPNAEDV